MSARKQKAATPAEQSALDALQAVLDEERVAHVATRLRLEREVEALRSRIGELEGELAQSAARIRELDSRLQARAR